LNCAKDIFVAVKRCKNKNARVFVLIADFFDCADAIQFGHPQIEQGHIRAMLLPKIDCFTTIFRFA
jgi:hypothetical protein